MKEFGYGPCMSPIAVYESTVEMKGSNISRGWNINTGDGVVEEKKIGNEVNEERGFDGKEEEVLVRV